ncbi:dihydrolipoamide acetyltransferase family protein [Pseudogracilibacillus sp. SO30301A]|uniref:dihydrolipoamide acetyltransferase family protein n=1 Tax=Pseudogracilibacillus sp. SO30301A TaxID=3098291 RepID=UPI00300E0CFE
MEVKFHDIGEGMTEGEIVNYFVKVGDKIGVDEPLLEIQTDKMVAEIPSPVAGKVTSIFFKPGDTITVGETIMVIDDHKKQAVPIADNKQGLEKSAGKKRNSLPKRYNGILAAPYTRKIARELGVDIEKITGTGRAGRVTEEDVYAFINKQKQTQKITEAAHPKITPEKTEVEIIPFKGIRKQIATNLTQSVRTIPHVTHFDEVDITNLQAYRKELKAFGEDISIVPFFLKALVVALKEHPLFNAELDEEQEIIRLHKAYHIGLATDTDTGLLVPVLRDVDKKSLRVIHNEMKQLTEKAQQGKITVKEMQGGTFTISNVGPLGGTWATPIINHPQTGIMAFHKTKRVPVVMKDDEIAIRSIMNISLSFDHRVADGADSVRFANRFIELIEEPKRLIMELI